MPLGAINHLCGLALYMSQPNSPMLSRIMPGTCAPSIMETMPFARASAHISFTGCTTPVVVVMWLVKSNALSQLHLW